MSKKARYYDQTNTDSACDAGTRFQELAILEAICESARDPRNDELASAFGVYLRDKSSRGRNYRDSGLAIKAWLQMRIAALHHGTFVDEVLMADLETVFSMHCEATPISA